MADPQYYYSGQSGKFYLDGQAQPSGVCRDWSFAAQMATLDATTLGDTYKVPVNGIRSISGSATLFWASKDDARTRDKTASDAISKLITKRTGGDSDPGFAPEAGQSVELVLRVENGYTETGKAGRGIDMKVKITGLAMSMAHGEIFSANITFESIGAPTEITL